MHEHARQVVENIIAIIESGETGRHSTGGVELMQIISCGSSPEHTCDAPEKCGWRRERLWDTR